ncbi:methyl-accepting chemotaxis protein [Cohnella sp. GCM10027633]|uniref:methyl-accepting chemotaxis protein n=1 Tax=unclassified Cohnella TaxID=2636738 RepID=UPI003629D53E
MSYKLFASLAIALLMLIATNGMGIRNLDKMSGNLIQTLYEETYRGSDLLLNADRDMYQALLDEHTMSGSEPGTDTYDSALRSYEENVAQVAKRVADAKRIFEGNAATYDKMKHETSGNAFFDSFATFENNFGTWTGAVKEMQDDTTRTVVDEASFQTARESLNELEEMLVVHAELHIEEAKKDNRNMTWGLVIAVLLSIAVVTSFGQRIFRSIIRTIKQTVHVTEQVAGGNLQVDPIVVRSKDELGQLSMSINRMTESLREMIHRIMASSTSLTEASRQISAATEEISDGATNQASNSQHVMELFKELSYAIQTVAVNAESTAELAEETVSIAGDGADAVTASKAGMNEASGKMSRLKDDSDQIGVIIEVIDDISEQTNLLALNAAIEAARAGEQGRGFAVVADEVRKLAERSTEATKQITSIIKGMQLSTAESVQAVARSVAQTEVTEQAFHRITEHVNQSSRKVMEIAAASQEQAAQTSEVLQSVESIAAASEQTAAASGQTAESSQSLASLAAELNRMVASFKV